MKLTPTKEQQDILDLASTGINLKIQAVAGSGKSSTLKMIAEQSPVPSLYLVFNKSAADEAREKFPSYVEVRTMHSLAFGVTGIGIRNKLNRPTTGYKNVAGTSSEIAKYFKITEFRVDEDTAVTPAGVGLSVKETVARYEASWDDQISDKHVSFTSCHHVRKNPEFKSKLWVKEVIKYAKKLWALRINPKSDVLATHDTYLKLYQLSKPDLSKYEIIYVDEQQDSSDVMIDIVIRQTESQIILVGDSHQNIYSWRGSVDALSKVDYKEMTLSQSFRYGQAVANVANDILGQMVVVGSPDIDTLITGDELMVDKTLPYAILYRTNGCLITDAVDRIKDGESVEIEIDTKSFVRLLDSVLALYNGEKNRVKHELILSFDKFSDLEDSEDADIQRAIKLVQGGKVYDVLGVLTRYKKPYNPDVTLTTAHKSKGREWDQVVMANDFKELDPCNEMEKNLLYVAATRARKVLVYNHAVLDAMSNYSTGSGDVREPSPDALKSPLTNDNYEQEGWVPWYT